MATLLFFFVLQSHATDGWRMRFLSQLELPSLATDNSTRVLLADGPFALLCGSELMTILTLSTNGRFVLWRSRVSLGSSHRQVVSCAFVSDVDSTCSHLMLHCCSQQASPSSQRLVGHWERCALEERLTDLCACSHCPVRPPTNGLCIELKAGLWTQQSAVNTSRSQMTSEIR